MYLFVLYVSRCMPVYTREHCPQSRRVTGDCQSSCGCQELNPAPPKRAGSSKQLTISPNVERGLFFFFPFFPNLPLVVSAHLSHHNGDGCYCVLGDWSPASNVDQMTVSATGSRCGDFCKEAFSTASPVWGSKHTPFQSLTHSSRSVCWLVWICPAQWSPNLEHCQSSTERLPSLPE